RREGRANLALADYVAPRASGLSDHIGAFTMTEGIGADEAAEPSGGRRSRMPSRLGRTSRKTPRCLRALTVVTKPHYFASPPSLPAPLRPAAGRQRNGGIRAPYRRHPRSATARTGGWSQRPECHPPTNGLGLAAGQWSLPGRTGCAPLWRQARRLPRVS